MKQILLVGIALTAAAASSGAAAQDVVGGNIVNGAVDAAAIGTNAVGNDELAPNAVASGNIQDGSVGVADIGTNAVGNDELAPNAVASGNIQDGSVGVADIGTNAVGNDELQDNITVNTLAATNVITTNDLVANGQVQLTNITSGAASAAQTGTLQNGQIEFVTTDQSGNIAAVSLDDLDAELGLPGIRNRLTDLEDDVDQLQGGVAAAFAIGSIQQDPSADGLQLSLAYGNWEGNSGGAVMAGVKVVEGVYLGVSTGFSEDAVGGSVTGTVNLGTLGLGLN